MAEHGLVGHGAPDQIGGMTKAQSDMLAGAQNSSFASAATNGFASSGNVSGSPLHLSYDYRLEALRIAAEANPGFAPTDVTKRAQAYYDFLTGKEAQ